MADSAPTEHKNISDNDETLPDPKGNQAADTSDGGGEYHPEGVAGSLGKAKDTAPVIDTRPPSSRSGLPSRKGSAGRRFGGFGSSMANSSRISQYSNRTSTHAPSVTSSAFFRPLSSSRLQAQRAIRPHTGSRKENAPLAPVGLTDTGPASRASLESDLPSTPRAITSHDTAAPSSRGTESTSQEPHDRAYHNASPAGQQTIQESVAGSTSPLTPTLGVPQVDKNREYRLSSSLRTSLRRLSQQPQAIPRDEEAYSNGTNSPHQEKIRVARAADGKNHEYFTGNTVFFLGGRIQNTRDKPVNIATGLLVIIPGVLFFVFCAPYMWYNISPALPLVFAYIYFLCLSSFFHASMTDPGILPRNLHPLPPPENDDPLTLGPPTTNWTMVRTFAGDSGAMDVPTKYCKSCNIWRPPRAHHCRVCDNCIETQDHHCVWLNNCIGRRNYRYFFTFIFTASILCLYLSFAGLGQCIHYMNSQSVSFAQAIDVNRVAFALFFYGLLAVPYPFCLVGYHLVLMGRALTTREYLNAHKFQKADRHRPYDHGSWIKNWFHVLARERTPTYLRFKAEYIEGDPRFGPRRGKRDHTLTKGQQGASMEMSAIRT